MINISRLSDYAVVVLSVLEQGRVSQAGPLSAGDIAFRSTLPEPTVAKILKMLARKGFVGSVRGAHGGYTISKRLSEINVADIVLALEGPVSMTACSDHLAAESCAYQSHCAFKGKWGGVNKAIHEALEKISLQDMLGTEAL